MNEQQIREDERRKVFEEVREKIDNLWSQTDEIKYSQLQDLLTQLTKKE